jgi:WD40 repeat protein
VENDGVVRVWDVSSGEAVSGLEDGHEASVMEVNVSPDGRSALSIDRRGVVVVWDLEAAEMRFRLHGDAAALSPDGRLVGTANRHGTSAVYGVEDGVLIARYRWSGPTIGTAAATAGGEDLWRRARVAFSQDGGMVVASAGGSAWVWDVKSARLLGSRSGRATIRTVSFSPDGDWVASGDAFGTVELWSAFDGALVAGIPPVGAEGGMSDIAFAPDGRTFVPVGGQPEVRIRDSESGESVATIRGHQAQGISDVAYSPDGSLLATAGGDGTARIWNSSTGEEVDRLVGHRGQVSSVRFTPEGDLLVTGGEDGTIRVWAARPSGLITLGEAEGLPPGTIYAEGLVAVSPDGGSIITAEPEGSISVFDATTGAEQGDIPALDAPAIFAGFSQDGEAVAVADVDGSVAVLAWPSGEQLDVILDEGVVAVAPFAPQTGQLLLYREADDPLLEVWTLEDDGSLTQAFSRALPAIDQDYAFAPDGRMLALSLRRPAWSVHLIDLESGETVHEFGADLPGSTGYVPDVDFNPDGSRLLMARWEGHVGVADVATGDMLLDLEHGGTVTTAEYSPDGKLILTTGLDGSAKLWDASRGEVVLEMSHPGSIDWSGFTPDGRFVWTSGQDVRLFDATSGALITVLPLRTPSLDHEFNPVTGDMVGASLDGTSWIFHCEVCGSLGELLTLADSRATRELTPQERATYLTASA